MKRLLIAALIAVALPGCGSVGQTTETPQQVVSTASQKMSQLHAAKFDISATILEQFPPSFTQNLGPQGAALSNLTVDLSAKGQAKFPAQAAMSLQVKTGSISVSTDVVLTGGKLYIKDPQSGSFIEAHGTQTFSQFTNLADPLSGASVLKTAESVKDLGDTTLNGVAVHHYQIVPDKNKLADQAATQQAKEVIRGMLQSGSVQLEAWIGKDDHLLHRVKDDTDATIDLNQALQAAGQQLPSGVTLPPGSTVHTVVHATINYYDFNAQVTVTAPAVSPS